MEAAFENICRPYEREGLKAALLTDREGITLLKFTTNEISSKILSPLLATTFSMTSDQSSKLGLGQNNTIISTFSLHQILQFNHSPLIITLVANSQANTGLLLELGAALRELTEPIIENLTQRRASNPTAV
ncbi:uncharacterized protein VTP21DRAFT_2625 [Calcarisporiella thermophila]|uniref:uncharacterized protein n=1 Tax=Calcarisporiella thermophila TaxID=911321 RepID=UPI0037443858